MTDRSGRWAGLAAVNVASVVLGAAALFGRVDAAPVWIVAGRCAFSAVTLVVIALMVRAPLRLPLGSVPRVLATAAVLAVHWVAFFASVQVGGVAIATLTVSAFPLFTLLIEAALARRGPSLVELAAGAVIIVAVALVARPGWTGASGQGPGAALGVAAAALFAVFTLASRPLARDFGPLRLSVWQYAAVAVLLAPALPFGRAPADGAAWIAIAGLGVVVTSFGHQLYLYALGRLPAAVCGSVISLEPVYAIALAALLFGDPIGPAVAASAALIIGATLALLLRGR